MRKVATPVLRTHEAGALRADQIGQTVTLAGWVAKRRDHGGVAFLDLRDASGVVQVVVRDEAVAHGLRAEYCLLVTGLVGARPEGNENDDLATGAIEVSAERVEVLSAAAPLPFQIDDRVEVGEEARLRYRYLDLRRPAPAELAALLQSAADSQTLAMLDPATDVAVDRTIEVTQRVATSRAWGVLGNGAKIRSTIKRHRARQFGYSGFSWQEEITEEKRRVESPNDHRLAVLFD